MAELGQRKELVKKRKIFSVSNIVSVIVFLVFAISFRMAFSPTLVSGTSMSPTLHDRDIWFAVSKNLYKPAVGDIVRAYSRDDMVQVVKRIVAVSGDEVSVSDKGIYVNGVLLDASDETMSLLDDSTTWVGLYKDSSFKLRDGDYFLLGDNRNDSKDSRYYGVVSYRDLRATLTMKAPQWLKHLIWG